MFNNEYDSEHTLENILKKIKYDLKQNLIISKPPPKLTYITISMVAITLWRQQLACDDLKQEKYTKDMNIYDVIRSYEKEIMDKVYKSEIPIHCCIESFKSVINLVGEAITQFIFFHFDTFDFPTNDKLKIFLKNVCWTQQGTINHFKTARRIIHHSDLSLMKKYEIAYKYCMEDRIRILLKRFPKIVLNSLIDETSFSLPAFWAPYINNEIFPSTIEVVPDIDDILKFAIENGNLNAVQYFWEHFTNNSIRERVTDFAEHSAINNNPEILLYFCKQMNSAHLEEISLKSHCELLKKLNKISRCFEILQVDNHILKVIKTKNVLYAFELITFCWYENLLDLEELDTVWTAFSLCFRLDIEQKITDIYSNNFSKYQSNCTTKQIIITNLLLQQATSEQKEDLIYGEDTLLYCEWLITFYKGLDIFDYFTSQILHANEIYQFNIDFFKIQSGSLCISLIMDNEYKLLDKILNEFCSEDNLKFFKNKFILENAENIMLKILDNECEMAITTTDKFLNGCCDDNKEEILRFKEVIFDLDSVYYRSIKNKFFNNFRKTLTHKKWDLIDRYFKWIFYATNEVNIYSPIRKLERVKKILHLMFGERCWWAYLRNIDCYEFFENIVKSFFNKDEIEKIKYEFKTKNDLLLIVKEMFTIRNRRYITRYYYHPRNTKE